MTIWRVGFDGKNVALVTNESTLIGEERVFFQLHLENRRPVMIARPGPDGNLWHRYHDREGTKRSMKGRNALGRGKAKIQPFSLVQVELATKLPNNVWRLELPVMEDLRSPRRSPRNKTEAEMIQPKLDLQEPVQREPVLTTLDVNALAKSVQYINGCIAVHRDLKITLDEDGRLHAAISIC